MAAASYDQLLKQVEALKMENSNLRQELEDNSNHLTKLETEASNMKEVLKQLQGSIEEDSKDSQGQIDFLERLKEMSLDPSSFPGVKLRAKTSVQGSSSGRSADGSPGPSPMSSFPRRGVANGDRDSAGYLEELEKERSLLMAELEKEEKEKDWYYAQLQNLTKRIDSLPLTENFSLQTDMTRRQLEYEARQIRAAMEEQLGTCQDMEKRAQARVARIQQIEKDMLRIRQHLHSQPAEAEVACRSPSSLHLDRISTLKQINSRLHAVAFVLAKHELGAQAEGAQASGDAGTGSGACSQAQSSRVDHDTASEMSSGGSYSVPRRLTSHLGTKVEMVYSLLSMLGTHDKDDMSRTLLAMSSSQDSCIAMRQSGCLPLLIQLLHGNDKDSVLLGNSRGSKEARARASAALHNIIHSQPDDKRGRREIRVLHLLEQIRAYCETCWEWQESHEQGVDQDKNPMPSPVEHQICPAVCVLMKLSFDEEHRHAMNELGGLQAIGELLQVDCEIYGLTSDHYSVTLRRYAGMALTNLTFGDVANKATLCSMKGCMRAMVAQLKSESEDLQQVIASVLRNLSWRADVNSKKTLREVGSVRALMECALEVEKESTLKSVLSALWNLSAHCTENKADICSVAGALAFLVSTLTYRSQTNTLAIIESGGGILRNVSSLIATNEEHRQILRENSCLQTLLQHLKSHSLTIVSNACGTLWNLSARNAKDQEALWDMGAVSMLKNLIHSKHKMIAMGSAAALRNLMANRPAKYKDANIMSPGSSLPSLHVRKQKALIEELDAQHLSETFDNIDNLSPKASHRGKPRHKHNVYGDYDGVCRSDGYNTSGVGVRSPYMNTPVLSSPSSRENRGNADNVRAERDKSLDRERRGFHPDPDTSKRMGMQIPTTAAQIAMVMEEVQSMHLGLEDRTTGSTPDPHMVQDDMVRRQTSVHSHQNIYSYNKPDPSGRPCPMPKLEYRASNDSLNSVNSTDGYGKRGQMKPSVDSYSEDDESKCCVYRKYPADLAHKIHNANHMEDDDGDLDTPINYSLKYSDEQLNSGRQSPSQNERWARPKILEDEMKRSDQKPPRSQSPGYPIYTEGNGESEDKLKKYQPRGSSLSSLSSEDEMESCQRTTESQSSGHYVRMKPPRHQGSHVGHGDGSRHHKTVEFSSGAKSPSKSGAQTPKSPPEHYVQETPLMFSRCTSVSSLESFESHSIASSVQSEPCSGMIMPPVHEDDHGNETEPEKEENKEPNIQEKPPATADAEKDILDDSDDDDDIEILEACINSAMPRKSSRKPKKQTPPTTSRIPPPVARKPTTSLSDLTIDSPPNELATVDIPAAYVESSCQRRDTVPEGDDILAECINSAMPKEGASFPDKNIETKKVEPKAGPRDFADKPANAEERVRPEKAELRKDKEQRKDPPLKNNGEQSGNTNRVIAFQTVPTKPLQKQSFPLGSKENTGTVPDEKQKFSIEDTPVEMPRPQASGYAPKAFHVEDTPVCFSRNSSLSSLSIDSEDDLLQECISSAMPKKKKQLPRKQALSPDSESFDWKAIQEGANSIVSSLHQAAASLSRQGSSDSDSILSLKSGISIGSPFHMPANKDDNKPATNKGPRILKPGEKSTLETKKKEEDTAKSLKGVSRGRTMIHVPGVRSSSPSTSPIPKKPPARGQVIKPPPQGPNSVNSPRTIKTPSKSDPSPAREPPASQGGSSKASSRSGSRDSTPSRPPQHSLTRPMQSPGRTSVSPGSGRISYTSPGRQLGQQTPPKQSGLPRSTSGIPRSESASKSLNQCGATGPSKKAELSRMSSTKSSGSESDRSEKPGLVRQSTFIKEAPSPTLKRKLEESASFESLSPSSPSQSQTPVSSPSLPDMSLTLPYQGSGWRKSPQSQNSSENGDGKSLRRHDISRSHSESPSRLPINRAGTWKREHSKHSSSLPRVGTWKRTGSSSSILSASSESSEKGRSEDERQPANPPQRPGHNKEGGLERKGTWRKIKEIEASPLMTLDLPDTSNDSVHVGTLHQMTAAVRKTEDVWVRIEDCPINNPRSKTNLNLVRSSESLDKKVTDIKPVLSNPNIATEGHEIAVAERTPFSSTNSSKHSSPGGTVAARKERNSVREVSLFFYCLTCVLGVPGNGLVVWIAGVKLKRTVNTAWFFNLAIADLLCCLSIPFTVADILLENHWPYGSVMCKVLPTIIVLNMFASVFTLNFISLDRFVQVVKPVWAQNNRSLRLAWGCCVMAWLMAFLLSLPTMILRNTEDFCNSTICTFTYSSETEGRNSTEADGLDQYRSLTVTRFVFGFLLPLLCIVVCYALIAWKVSSSQFRSGRAFQIMLAVVVAFFLSWLPYHVVGLVDVYGGEQVSEQARAVDPLVISFAYVNSCMNPVLYVFMGHDFKERIKLSLRRVFEKAFSEDGPNSTLNSKGLQSRATNSSEAQL
ncbi:hypothetical protein P4O66_000341 [Electrophorus voltai]|uniref:G-protein coupled receptors family 1 profile domain-containing protein n=1 Tax=Electrophorus voltai TaxID=2609070 RepID=A0AAD9E0X1_9TELE|nr:hypothetical protein P4O66_000341 [Electrophorus voltai]